MESLGLQGRIIITVHRTHLRCAWVSEGPMIADDWMSEGPMIADDWYRRERVV